MVALSCSRHRKRSWIIKGREENISPWSGHACLWREDHYADTVAKMSLKKQVVFSEEAGMQAPGRRSFGSSLLLTVRHHACPGQQRKISQKTGNTQKVHMPVLPDGRNISICTDLKTLVFHLSITCSMLFDTPIRQLWPPTRGEKCTHSYLPAYTKHLIMLTHGNLGVLEAVQYHEWKITLHFWIRMCMGAAETQASWNSDILQYLSSALWYKRLFWACVPSFAACNHLLSWKRLLRRDCTHACYFQSLHGERHVAKSRA